jgi:hypothetical protein
MDDKPKDAYQWNIADIVVIGGWPFMKTHHEHEFNQDF